MWARGASAGAIISPRAPGARAAAALARVWRGDTAETTVAAWWWWPRSLVCCVAGNVHYTLGHNAEGRIHNYCCWLAAAGRGNSATTQPQLAADPIQ